LWGLCLKIGGIRRYGRFERRDSVAARLRPDVSVAGEHARTDVARKLANRFF
jgi:hypothetical protein